MTRRLDRPPLTAGERLRVLIEQAIARGESHQRIATELGTDVGAVDAVRAAMDEVLADGCRNVAGGARMVQVEVPHA